MTSFPAGSPFPPAAAALVRVSVANLVSQVRVLESGETHIMGLLNRKALTKGRRLVGAIGGAAELSPKGVKVLKGRFGAVSFEGVDARFEVAGHHLEAVFTLFEERSPELFELDPTREIHEELGKVELIDQKRPVLEEGDLDQIQVSFLRSFRQAVPEGGKGTSAREGEIPSRRLFFLFEATAPQAVVEKLLSSEVVRKLTAEEVSSTKGGACKGATSSGEEIADNIVAL